MKQSQVASNGRSDASLSGWSPDSLRTELAGWLQDRIVQADTQFRSGLSGARWPSHVRTENAKARGTSSGSSSHGSRRKVEGWREQQQALHRIFDFWRRAVHLYGSYKLCQARVRLGRLSEEQRKAAWEEQHERGAEILHSLCTEMQGFFLKVRAPADPFPLVRHNIEAELARADVAGSDVASADVVRIRLEDVFAEFEEEPVGSASIAQVHRGKLKDGRSVAIKVQRAGAERLMLMDLANLRLFGAFLQKAELKVDLLGPISELEQQIRYEFDFEHEATAMERIRHALAQPVLREAARDGQNGHGPRQRGHRERHRGRGRGRHGNTGKSGDLRHGDRHGGGDGAELDTSASPVIVPAAIPGLVTRGLLVMDFIDGTPILRLPEEMRRRGISPNGMLARQAKSHIFSALSSAYGRMMLCHGHFQADPHPGNILVCDGGRVALLDYGQTKQLPEAMRLNLARLVVAIADQDMGAVGMCFRAMGIETAKTAGEDPNSFRRMAMIMFDTGSGNGVTSANPFGAESSLKSNAMKSFPSDIFFIVRTMMLLKGLATGMGLSVSTAKQWRPMALRVLRDADRHRHNP
ncbi:hypothetical protein CLOM_g2501 [Closterium sp. NIES-68]|nr:hypothetical protein CLOM_g2501 [Closterium sp. NIES-68]GJP74303.1 hypothetical protein CLOP_g4909 [Closterium sp. NIES-67]